MGFGSFLRQAVEDANDFGEAVQQRTQAIGGAVADGMSAVAGATANVGARAAALAQDAALFVGNEVVDLAKGAAHIGGQIVDAAQDIAVDVGEAVVDGAKTVAAVSFLAAEAGIVGAAAAAATRAKAKVAPVIATYNGLKKLFADDEPVTAPWRKCICSDLVEARTQRFSLRNELISEGMASPKEEIREAASNLREDMKAVELARLSSNTYDYDFSKNESTKSPPAPWKVMSAEEMSAKGIIIKDVINSKAVIYSIPDDFPFEPKEIVAFRGTTEKTDDILADHDQALGIENSQYNAAIALGAQVSEIFPGAWVTGHSLGGGKAQAAGVRGRLNGLMFNSAGLHPNTMNMSPEGLHEYGDMFLQYRADGGLISGGGDPLTLVQNSKALQSVAYGVAGFAQALGNANKWAFSQIGEDPIDLLPAKHQELAREMAVRILNVTPQQAARNYELSDGEWYVPPALGDVRRVVSKTETGEDAPIAGQHRINNLVFGFEARKVENISTLLEANGSKENIDLYISI
ncbi:MAG: hypothetical protein HQL40_00500 [Alphaproteobacteria bacterium]|nr:hypothetical protein [Alphaproteobacteria bacterium]